MADARSMQPQNRFLKSAATGLRDLRDFLPQDIGNSLIGRAPEMAEHYAYHSPFKENIEGISPRYPELHPADAQELGRTVIANTAPRAIGRVMTPTLRGMAAMYKLSDADKRESAAQLNGAILKGLWGAHRYNWIMEHLAPRQREEDQ